jgi:lipopolysaccharide transport system ATP-binding protein
MSNPAIRVEHLGKRYQIGAVQARYKTIRESLVSLVKMPRNKLLNQDSNHIWALKDVSFEVQPGEVVGIIGRNGAGKSTLLKVLAHITGPTEGRVEIHGRIGSLLEVGTGFHPELTGRENIYLNGAVLGMKRAEINRKFDEIINFAEIEKFLDTSVKYYSSGMYMRLAFAVAAHLEPEILLVDEVLAVGDAAFQKKCLGKMDEVAHQGKTVLLVSHNMVAVSGLCKNCLLIDMGCLKEFGNVNEIIKTYTLSFTQEIKGSFEGVRVKGDGRVQLVSYEVLNQHGSNNQLLLTNEDILIRIKLHVSETIQHPACGISIYNEQGVLLTSINTVELGKSMDPFPMGEISLLIRLENVSYLPGNYTANIWVMSPQGHIYVNAENAILFELAQTALYGTSQLDYRWGCVYTKVDFLKE